MAKRKPTTVKKTLGRRAAKRVAKRARVKPTPVLKAKAPDSAKADTAGAGEEKPSGEAIPVPEASPLQIDTLTAAVEVLRQLTTHGFESIERRLEDIEHRGPHQDAPPAVLSQADPRFASVVESLAEMREKIRSIHAIVKPPPRDTGRDLPQSLVLARTLLAGACKTLGFDRPTPAVIGRVMHDERAFEPRSAKSPYMLFDTIYNTVIRVLGIPGYLPRAAGGAGHDYVHLDEELVAMLTDISARPKKKHAEYYDKELKPRLTLLVNTHLARVDKHKNNYQRYLTPLGQSVFHGWPEWTDVTGGIGLVDDPHPPPEAPMTTGPDASATEAEPQSHPPSPPPPPPA